MKTNKLNDVFPNWLTGYGIFTFLDTYNVPWKEDNISHSLDIIYHGNISGKKPVSPLVESIRTGDSWSDTDRAILANTVFTLYGVNWAKQWVTLSEEYNPIENYSMVETMTDDETVITYGKTTTRTDNLSHGKTGTDTLTDNLTHGKTGSDTRTDNLTHGKTGTDTRTDNLSDVTTPDLENETESSVYGFNSSSAVPTGGELQTATGTNTVDHTGTQTMLYATSETNTGTQVTQYATSETDTGTETTQYNTTETDTGTQTDAETGSDSHKRNYKLERSGNIGVTTSQQMLQSERELWVWNFFNDVVFPDINKLLVLSVY